MMSPVVAVCRVPPDIGVAAWPAVVPSPLAAVVPDGLVVVVDDADGLLHAERISAATMTPVGIKSSDLVFTIWSYLLC